jgi:hypothetical protein
VFDVAFAVNERADLAACLVRKLGELPRKFGRDDLLRGDAPVVEFLDAAQLVGFETLCVAVYGTDVFTPSPRFANARRAGESTARQSFRLRAVHVLLVVTKRLKRAVGVGRRIEPFDVALCENTLLNRFGASPAPSCATDAKHASL